MTTVGKNNSKGWQGSPRPSHLEWQSKDVGEALFSSALGRKMLISLCVCVCVCVRLAAQSCLTLCDPMDCSPPGSSVCGILQARILERVAISHSKGSS